jgi:prolycopene isomerase
LCDRHFGGINYPVGGVGGIAISLADGLVEKGSEIRYKANVTNIILENGKAVSYLYRLKYVNLLGFVS